MNAREKFKQARSEKRRLNMHFKEVLFIARPGCYIQVAVSVVPLRGVLRPAAVWIIYFTFY